MGGDKGDLPGGSPAYPVSAPDESTHRLLTRYLERRREQLTQLESALAGADYELIRRIGHNLHGSGAAYGLPRISLIGGELEAGAERRDAAAIADNLSQLREFLEQVTIKGP